jgi:hypothetical protein
MRLAFGAIREVIEEKLRFAAQIDPPPVIVPGETS